MNIILYADNSSPRSPRVQRNQKNGQRKHKHTQLWLMIMFASQNEKRFFTTLLGCSNTFDIMCINAFPSYYVRTKSTYLNRIQYTRLRCDLWCIFTNGFYIHLFIYFRLDFLVFKVLLYAQMLRTGFSRTTIFSHCSLKGEKSQRMKISSKKKIIYNFFDRVTTQCSIGSRQIELLFTVLCFQLITTDLVTIIAAAAILSFGSKLLRFIICV